MQFFQLVFKLVFIFLGNELSFAYPLFNECIDLCTGSELTRLDPSDYEQVVCQRGCTFYQFDNCDEEIKVFPHTAESTLYNCKFKCGISCLDSYSSITESSVCTKGCELIGGLHEDMVKDIIQRSKEPEKVAGNSDKDIDFALISDPSIKSQLGKAGDYKIPETKIRTMPIDKLKEDKKKDSGDWLDCASRNSGIPRWILLTAILSAVLIAVWLCFASEKKNSKEDVDNKPILDDDILKDPSTLEDPPMIISDHIHFIPPPPYEISLKEI